MLQILRFQDLIMVAQEVPQEMSMIMAESFEAIQLIDPLHVVVF